MACFLWNLAALHSELGSRIDRSTEVGIKAANKHFQLAAGALEAIGTVCMPHLPSLLGTSTSAGGPISVLAIRMGVQLMLGQAQLCFYEKAVKDRKAGTMKPSIIAKLAVQTGLFYGAAGDLCKQGVLASYLDPSWAGHCSFQHRCFLAAAEYWQSQAAKEEAQQKGSGYAEEIARLLRAEAHLKEALLIAEKARLGVSLTNGAAALQRTVGAARTSAEHDNRTVYMEKVPADGALVAVSAVSMVKPGECGLLCVAVWYCCCVLCAVCCVLCAAVCCCLSDVCCRSCVLWFDARSTVCCLLPAACCLLSAVCCLLAAVCWLLPAVDAVDTVPLAVAYRWLFPSSLCATLLAN